MLTRDVTSYPYGGVTPAPGLDADFDAPATDPGRSGTVSRFEGQQDTLAYNGFPVGAGEMGWTGRDVTDPARVGVPYAEGRGMFGRLHEEGGS